MKLVNNSSKFSLVGQTLLPAEVQQVAGGQQADKIMEKITMIRELEFDDGSYAKFIAKGTPEAGLTEFSFTYK